MRARTLAAPALLLAAAALVATPAVAAPGAPAAHRPHVSFSYLGETELPHAQQFRGTTVGGLSGISWDRRTGQYLLISDDRSATNPARVYTARISASKGRVAASITNTRPLRQPDGSTYPATSADGSTVAPDPEGVAVDPLHERFAWSNEGERRTDPLVLADPTVRIADTDARTVLEAPKAPQLHMNAQQVGPRQNQALEGLSYSPDGRALFSGMEDPLYQDGEDPALDRGALVRITRHDATTALPVAQYAYRLQPLFEAGPAGSTNGLSDLVSLGGSRFLMLERAFTTRDVVRVYEADASRATDVLDRDSLAGRPAPVPMTKRLVVDLSKVRGLPKLDNVEGITLGPRLKDGRRLVVLVSDDNFSASEVTQFIAFAAKGL